MARGTQHRKRRPQQNAGVAAPEGRKAKKKQQKYESWEDQLFFSKLRNHAKWVFVLLALVFGLGFVLFGIGSGTGGIGEAFPDIFASNSGPSISSLEKRVAENPKDAQAWRDLATQLQQNDDRLDEAAAALTQYTKLRPKDASGLQQLGAIYRRQAERHGAIVQAAQIRAQAFAPGGAFAPSESSPLAKLFEDSLSGSITSQFDAEVSEAYSQYLAAQTQTVTVYKKLVALNPSDATNQFQLGQIAESAGDSKAAIAAYKKFLVLAPNDALAPAARQALQGLTATPTATVTGQ